MDFALESALIEVNSSQNALQALEKTFKNVGNRTKTYIETLTLLNARDLSKIIML